MILRMGEHLLYTRHLTVLLYMASYSIFLTHHFQMRKIKAQRGLVVSLRPQSTQGSAGFNPGWHHYRTGSSRPPTAAAQLSNILGSFLQQKEISEGRFERKGKLCQFGSDVPTLGKGDG